MMGNMEWMIIRLGMRKVKVRIADPKIKMKIKKKNPPNVGNYIDYFELPESLVLRGSQTILPCFR